MTFSFLTHTPKTVQCRFTVGAHQGPDGIAPELTHHLRVVTGKEFNELFAAYRAAMTGKEGDERDRATAEAAVSIWDRLVERVSGYGAAEIDGETRDVSELRGDELRAFWRGETGLPADLDDERRREILDAMREHIVRAVRVYFAVNALDYSFRSEGA